MECTLCCEEIDYFGLTECEHRSVCSLCWYRMIMLLRKSSCTVCRADCSIIFIVDDPRISFSELQGNMWGNLMPNFYKDEASGMYFQDKSEYSRLLMYKKIVCKMCGFEAKNISEYRHHSQAEHRMVLCDQCLQNNKLFVSEQDLYEEKELQSHKASLHKKCNVCNLYFYDGIQLVAHIKNQHQFCELCPFEKRVAFLNYDHLEDHFRQNHYYCMIKMCRDTRYIAFGKYDEFREHYKKEHPGLQVPNPNFAFKLKEEEEEKKCVFEDSGKSHSKPIINNRFEDFPALAPPSNEKRILDYSKVIAKPNCWNKPQPSVYKPSPSSYQPQAAKPAEKHQNQNKPMNYFNSETYDKAQPLPSHNTKPALMKNVNEVHNGFIPSEIPLAYRIPENQLANSHREGGKPNMNDGFEEVKRGHRPMELPKSDFPPPQNPYSQHHTNFPKSIRDTLFENIMFLNTGLIDAKIFAINFNEFVTEAQYEASILVIQEHVRPEARCTEVINLIKKNFWKRSHDYPSLPKKVNIKPKQNQPKPKPSANIFENLRDEMLPDNSESQEVIESYSRPELAYVKKSPAVSIPPKPYAVSQPLIAPSNLKPPEIMGGHGRIEPAPVKKTPIVSIPPKPYEVNQPVMPSNNPKPQEIMGDYYRIEPGPARNAPTVSILPKPYIVSQPIIAPSAVSRRYETTLDENIGLLNLKLISVKEFVSACSQIVPEGDGEYALEFIQGKIPRPENVIKELEKVFKINKNKQSGFVQIFLPPEPKKRKHRK